MGAGVDLPRTLMRAGLAGLVSVWAAGCIDFVAPDLPGLGGPAVIEATIRVTDRGSAEVVARLVPGLDSTGRRRGLPDETLEALGRSVRPDSVLRNGTRTYLEAWVAEPGVVAGPTRLRAPEVEGVLAPAPRIAWAGLARTGPDTIRLSRGEDLWLMIRPGLLAASPSPEIRQWVLRLAGESGAFALSADGVPPDTIFVPARWIPEDTTIEARLIYSQSAVLQAPPGDYVGLVTLDTRLFWTLRVRPEPAR